jgi:hypothetical protein
MIPASRPTRPIRPTPARRHSTMALLARVAKITAVATLVAAAGSCAPDSTAPAPAPDTSQLFWAVALDQHAVTLSVVPPWDTLRLHATARGSSGTVLANAPAPHFASTDVEHVQVDGAGVLHAIKPGANIVVVAVDTVDDIVHADTAWVTVTDVASPPVLAALIFPAMDSAKFALGGNFFGDSPGPLTAQALDTAGTPIAGVAVHYASSDPRVATIDPRTGIPTLKQVGHVTFTATATAYGVTRSDTLPFTVGMPILLPVNLQVSVGGGGDTVVTVSSPVTIGVGGDIAWMNTTSVPLEVTFDDPTSAARDEVLCENFGDPFCDSGNVDAFAYRTGDDLYFRLRQFRVPGTYHYHIRGVTGTIIVQRD